MTDVHLINHTHWDREWFLTHEYTTAWVPALIDSLERLAAENDGYDFLFDGQTLAIEDLLGDRPEYEARVRELVSGGQLEIGPCYSQPDWRMVSGELHVRNLLYGMGDAERLGGSPKVAWLVDTFGHISQAPQLLTQAGLESAFVWRGVPQMTPLFRWQSPDGTELATIDLFGGYRNLYGITKTPDIAMERLVAETHKLAPSYGDLPIPLFDGYDLDTEPEDPFRLYGEMDVPANITLHESSPEVYAESLRSHVDTAPLIAGELLSGKFGSTFPGSLSARTYLKVLHSDTETAMHRIIEPLAAMAAEHGHNIDAHQLERASRTLLQNGVHDCLCGVSIDQVHERMERSYRELLEWADDAQSHLADRVLSGFSPGVYAISSNAIATDSTVRAGDRVVRVAARGIGITPVVEESPIEAVGESTDRFEWSNDHFTAHIDASGIHVDGCGQIARFVVRRDEGDTYSSEPRETIGELAMTAAPVLLDRSEIDATVRTEWSLASGDLEISAVVNVRFDDGPVVDCTIDLDSSGVGFRVDAEFDTGIATTAVHAGMPFDCVARPHDDDDLFGSEIDDDLAAILMGQRETGHVTEFPFHDFVASSNAVATRAVFARGLRSYRSNADGTIAVALRRSVEWLAETGLTYRIGDAGPAMYVPGARCERVVQHRIGFAVLAESIDAAGFRSANEAFQNPPVIATVQTASTTGDPASLPWTIFAADLPVSAVLADSDTDGAAVVRLYNPTQSPVALKESVTTTTIRHCEPNATDAVDPGKIVTTSISVPGLPAPHDGATVSVLTPIQSRVQPARSRPDPLELDALSERIASLEAQLVENEHDRVGANGGPDGHRLTHRTYVLDRERLELMLSLELNRRRAATDDEVSIPDAPDPEIAEIGLALNDLRVKRRIWDYVVQALG